MHLVSVPIVHRTAAPPYTFEDTIIRLRFDLSRDVVYGHETVVIHPAQGIRNLPFDSAGIRYDRVSVDGTSATYSTDTGAQRISVDLPHAAKPGTAIAIDFVYHTNPQAGLYFVKPDNVYRALTPEIWTQGEPTDNRRWFPTWDEPNAKTPSELIVTVPRNWTVIGNGFLKSRTVNASVVTWDWRSPQPKSTYLIAFAAGPFSSYHAKLGALDVDSFVPPAYAHLNATCFGETPRMIAYFQRKFGVAYPFSKYDQVAAERFFFGGMENESVTIVADRALHPAVEDRENSCDLVVSHELGQHWFGDDATMMDWSNEWLNEGFATYSDELWTGERGGNDAFAFARYEAQQAYFEETRHDLRPIVDYVYAEPLELFDTTGHEGAAERIHMLRYLFGDRRFFAALRDYLIEYRYRNATTRNFFTSIDRSLGTNLSWFENEWFYRAAYPTYDVRFGYDSKDKQLTLDIAQSTQDAKPFVMPVEIDIYTAGHVVRTRRLIDSMHQRIAIGGVASVPQMILFDPNDNIVRKLHFDQPPSMLAYEATNAPDVPDRLWAIAQLERLRHPVPRATVHDEFYGVRAAAVAAEARLGDSASVTAGLSDGDVRVQLAALDAVTMLKAAPAPIAEKVYALASSPNPDVAAAALLAIGRLRLPNAYALLTRAANSASFRSVIASGALQGLAALGDPRAYGLIVTRTSYGVDENERNHAVAALALLAPYLHRQPDALRRLVTIAVKDPIVSTRLAAISALADLGDTGALPTLQQLAQSDPLSVVRLSARTAISSLAPH